VGKRILVVDDDQDICEVLLAILESESYEVEVANDGTHALAKMETGLKPDLILLDMMMPRMDGITFVREIQQRGLRTSIPIVLLSAHVRSEEQVGQMNLEGFISKPFDVSTILDTIDTLI
jgi:CheY-like chemotaxis protein